jgi:hypothetical protein
MVGNKHAECKLNVPRLRHVTLPVEECRLFVFVSSVGVMDGLTKCDAESVGAPLHFADSKSTSHWTIRGLQDYTPS